LTMRDHLPTALLFLGALLLLCSSAIIIAAH
jgi:hypothetical protein